LIKGEPLDGPVVQDAQTTESTVDALCSDNGTGALAGPRAEKIRIGAHLQTHIVILTADRWVARVLVDESQLGILVGERPHHEPHTDFVSSSCSLANSRNA